MEKKFSKIDKKNDPAPPSLIARIEDVCDGLVYVSETDAPVVPFDAGRPADASAKGPASVLKLASGEKMTEVPFGSWFARQTEIKDWFGEIETSRAKKFLELKDLLEENLSDLRVYRAGSIRIDIYIIGRSPDGRVLGVRTHAVET